MKSFLILAIIFLSSSVEYTFGGVNEAIDAIFCELPVAGKDSFYSCLGRNVPFVQEVIDYFANCAGKSVAEEAHAQCCNPHTENTPWIKHSCIDEFLDKIDSPEEKEGIMEHTALECLFESFEAYKEEMNLPISKTELPSSCQK